MPLRMGKETYHIRDDKSELIGRGLKSELIVGVHFCEQ